MSMEHFETARQVFNARGAQAIFESFSQEQIDVIVRDIGKYVYDHAEVLARAAIEETGVGVYEDKVLKNRGKARLIWNSLKGRKSRGVIEEEPHSNLILVAKPMGVIGAVTPITNPIVTPMCNAMFALKAGNAIIFAPHPRAQRCTRVLVDAFMDIVRRHDGPPNLVQMIEHASLETTAALMRSVDVIVATGGSQMVKAAYSSGRPSFGVGAGNVPVIIDRDANLQEAAEMIVAGASFDNGMICSHEQFVLAPVDTFAETCAAFQATNKVWYTDDDLVCDKFRALLFSNDAMNRDLVGRSALEIAARVGITPPAGTRVILLRAKGAGPADVLAREKLFPVVAILPYDTFDSAIEAAKANLRMEGAGHSAAVHSNNESHIRRVGLELPVCRVIVNQPCALTAGGSFTNGFAATTTLGCGSWGGNSLSENLDFMHLLNLSRIGRKINHRDVPTDTQIWQLSHAV